MSGPGALTALLMDHPSSASDPVILTLDDAVTLDAARTAARELADDSHQAIDLGDRERTGRLVKHDDSRVFSPPAGPGSFVFQGAGDLDNLAMPRGERRERSLNVDRGLEGRQQVAGPALH